MVDAALMLNSDLASTLVKGGAGLLNILKEVSERANNAQERYQQSSAKSEDPLEQKRLQCLSTLSELRNRVTLCGCNKELQRRALCLVMDQTANAFEATNLRSLELVLVDAEQIRAALESDAHSTRQRRRTRRVGVLVSTLSLIAIGSFIGYAKWANIDGQSVLPFLGIPPCVIFWSGVGSFAAILYRFTNAGDRELEDPLRWLFSRPLTGIIMGTITYLVIKTGLLTIDQGTSAAASPGAHKTNEIMWLIAFLAGFSDRFSDGLLRSLVGKFGGDKSGDLVSLQATSTSTSIDLLPSMRSRKSQEPAAAAHVVTVLERKEASALATAAV